MNLSDAVEVWGQNALSMPDDGPNLPYASLVAVALGGAAREALSLAVLSGFASSPYGREEVPLDMAAARCKAIDSQFYDEYFDARGRRPKGPAVMEASWLATDRALYYIAPNVGGMRRWPWSGTGVKPGRTGRQFAKFTLATEQGTWKFSTGARALPNLLACESWAHRQ